MRNIVIVAFVLIAACGGDAPASDDVAACEFSAAASGVTVRSCGELETDDVDEQESQCKDSGNVKAKLVDRCSTDDVLGTCVLTRDGESMTLYYYNSEGLTEEIVLPIYEEANGTWTAS